MFLFSLLACLHLVDPKRSVYGLGGLFDLCFPYLRKEQ